MRKRSEIATGADRPFLWNYRAYAAIQQFTKRFDKFQPDSAETEGQHVRAQQHHRSHFGL